MCLALCYKNCPEENRRSLEGVVDICDVDIQLIIQDDDRVLANQENYYISIRENKKSVRVNQSCVSVKEQKIPTRWICFVTISVINRSQR